jgi:MFS family permease
VTTPVTVLIAISTTETCHKVIIYQKTKRLQEELGNDRLKSCYELEDLDNRNPTGVIITSLARPLKMLFLSPHIFFLSLYIAFVFGVVYLLYTTIPSVFSVSYGLSTSQTGLIYIALGLGNVLGWLVVTFSSDKIVIRLTRANNEVFEPEMRLTISIYFGIFLPITLFWYGWSSFYRLHLASTIISLIPYGFGIMGLFLPITTYLVDSHPVYAASAIAANVILRSLVGALLPLAGPPMYTSLGLGWGNSLLGFICVLMIPLPAMFYKFGARWRKAQRFQT